MAADIAPEPQRPDLTSNGTTGKLRAVSPKRFPPGLSLKHGEKLCKHGEFAPGFRSRDKRPVGFFTGQRRKLPGLRFRESDGAIEQKSPDEKEARADSFFLGTGFIGRQRNL